MQWVQTRHAIQSLWLELSSWFCWENLTFRSSHMDHTTYFSVEESTVYTSQLNKRKLASVGIEGTGKFCVKQQIYSYISPQKSVLICQGLCQTASRWMTVIKWLCQRTSIISLILNFLVSEINHDTCVALAGFHSPVNSYLPSPFWEKSEINESIFKMTEDAISFLRCENKTQIKPPCNWQDKMKRFIYLGDDSFFVR